MTERVRNAIARAVRYLQGRLGCSLSQGDVAAILFDHPDVQEADSFAGYWYPEEVR